MDIKLNVDFVDSENLLEYDIMDLIKESIRRALLLAGFEDDAFLTYTVANKEEIQKLNCKFKNKDYVTDVLSFPQYDEEGFEAIEGEAVFIGDIVICFDKLIEQAKEYQHSFEREISYISVHSALHLLGYDHINEDDKIEMRTMEKLIMEELRKEYYGL